MRIWKPTFYIQHDRFVLGVRHGVNCTSVLSLVLVLDVSDLQVPLLHEGTHDAEAGVIHHPPVLIGERDAGLVLPCHLVGKKSATWNHL